VASADKVETGRFKLGYRPALDGLRGLAVLAVLTAHSGLLKSGAASVGVDVFFVLSGFLITSLLIGEWDGSGRISLKDFYARRALRLLPALVVFLVVVTAGFWLIAPGETALANAGDALVALLYSTNWARAFGLRRPDLLGHTWTLSIEEQFYLLWPLLLIWLLRRTGSRRSMCYWLLLAIALVYVERVLLDAAGANLMRLSFGTDTRADSLLLGCLVGVLLSSNLATTGERRFVRWSAWAAALALVILTFYTGPFPVELQFFDSVVSVAAAILIFAMAKSKDCALNRGLAHSWLVYIGKISYGLYLWHHPIFRVVQSWEWPWQRTLVVEVAATVLVTLASFYLLERPFLRLKKRFSPIS
jgi:peptidoglycan/LPS O-acetylase OafA/YrhL